MPGERIQQKDISIARAEQIDRADERSQKAIFTQDRHHALKNNKKILDEIVPVLLNLPSGSRIKITDCSKGKKTTSFVTIEKEIPQNQQFLIRQENGKPRILSQTSFLKQAGIIDIEPGKLEFTLNEENYNYYLALNTPKIDQSGT